MNLSSELLKSEAEIAERVGQNLAAVGLPGEFRNHG